MYKPRRDSYSDRRSGGSRFGGGDSYPRRENRDRGGFGGGRGGDREERPSFEAICAKCDKPCRVPFRPTGSKPVLCKACFEQDGGNKPSFGGRPSFGGDRGGDRGGFGGGRDRDFRSDRSDRPVTRTLGDRDNKPSKLEEQMIRMETKLDALLLKLGAPSIDVAPKKVSAPTPVIVTEVASAPEKKGKKAKKEEKIEAKPEKAKKGKKAKIEIPEEIEFN